MSDDKKKRKLIGSVELLVVKDYPSRYETGAGSKIRVVQWLYDDGKFSVKLERRGYFTKEGKVMTGKAEGFGLDDLAALHPRWKDAIQLMKNPPKPPPPPAPAPKPQQEDDVIEEVPF
jgi:hypothetical protein